MSDYRLDISGDINLSDYSNISDYIELVDSNDSFTIALDDVEPQNIDLLCSMLQDRNFIITSRREYNKGRTYISAIRKNMQ